MQEKLIGMTSLTVLQVRMLIILGIFIILCFMVTDLDRHPDSIKDIYILSRIGIQIPMFIIFLAASFLPSFFRLYQPILIITMLIIVCSNYWFTIRAWEIAEYSFTYAGITLYGLFAMFIFRMSLLYSIAFSTVVFLCFVGLTLNYPVYGAYSLVNSGVVLTSLLVSIIGVYKIEDTLSKLAISEKKLKSLSQTDSLTGLLNRRTYETKFSELFQLCTRSQSKICVYIIDIDFFKDYNDGYGHVKGDEVIKQQANNLKEVFKRDTDIIARYGGEEFIVVTSGVTEQQSGELALRVIQQWQELKIPHGKGQAPAYISCSIGFYFYQPNLKSNNTLAVQRADEALYQAKQQGRNRYVQYKG